MNALMSGVGTLAKVPSGKVGKWVVFGLCVVLPWALVGYGGYRVVRRLSRPAAASATPPAA